MSLSSRRTQRMKRRKMRKQPALNLVSLMDIFTILVFFLLVSSSSAQQPPNSKDFKLPTSTAKKAPKETLIITITSTHILVQGRRVAQVPQVLADNSDIINGLQRELQLQSGKGLLIDAADKRRGRAVTIMGDEQLPYALIRKILATCRQANYTQIAFAAIQQTKS